MSVPTKHLRTVANQDGAVVLNTNTGALTTLNPCGAFIWQALERGDDEQSIAANLVAETGAPQATVVRDVREFIAALHDHDLVEI